MEISTTKDQVCDSYHNYQLVVFAIKSEYHLVIWDQNNTIVLNKEFDVSCSLWIKFSFEGIMQFGKWWIDHMLEGK